MDNGLFAHIVDLPFRRNWKQAIAFYFVWTLVLFIVSGVIAMLGVVASGAGSAHAATDMARRFGAICAWFFCTGMAGTIVAMRGSKSVIDFVLVLVTAVVSLAGGIVGMIPVAYLSTRAPAKNPSSEAEKPTEQ